MNQLLVPLLLVTFSTLVLGVIFLLLLVAAAGIGPAQRRTLKNQLHRWFCRICFDCFGHGPDVRHSKG